MLLHSLLASQQTVADDQLCASCVVHIQLAGSKDQQQRPPAADLHQPYPLQ